MDFTFRTDGTIKLSALNLSLYLLVSFSLLVSLSMLVSVATDVTGGTFVTDVTGGTVATDVTGGTDVTCGTVVIFVSVLSVRSCN